MMAGEGKSILRAIYAASCASRRSWPGKVGRTPCAHRVSPYRAGNGLVESEQAFLDGAQATIRPGASPARRVEQLPWRLQRLPGYGPCPRHPSESGPDFVQHVAGRRDAAEARPSAGGSPSAWRRSVFRRSCRLGSYGCRPSRTVIVVSLGENPRTSSLARIGPIQPGQPWVQPDCQIRSSTPRMTRSRGSNSGPTALRRRDSGRTGTRTAGSGGGIHQYFPHP